MNVHFIDIETSYNDKLMMLFESSLFFCCQISKRLNEIMLKFATKLKKTVEY